MDCLPFIDNPKVINNNNRIFLESVIISLGVRYCVHKEPFMNCWYKESQQPFQFESVVYVINNHSMVRCSRIDMAWPVSICQEFPSCNGHSSSFKSFVIIALFLSFSCLMSCRLRESKA